MWVMTLSAVKRTKAVPIDQAPVVQTLDSAIHWITQLVLLVFIRWIVIYPVDSAIHRLNNWGQKVEFKCSPL